MNQMTKFDPVRLANEAAQMHAAHLELADILEAYAGLLKSTCTAKDMAAVLLNGRTNLEAQLVLRTLQKTFNNLIDAQVRAVVLQQLRDLVNSDRTGGQA